MTSSWHHRNDPKQPVSHRQTLMAWSSLPLSFSSLSFCLPSSSSVPLFSRSIRSRRSRRSLSCGSSVTDVHMILTRASGVKSNADDRRLHTHHLSPDVLEHPSLLPLFIHHPPLLLRLLGSSFQSLSFSLFFWQKFWLKRKKSLYLGFKCDIIFNLKRCQRERPTFASASSSAFFLARSSSNDRGWT